jgi:hypothetical protein
MLTDVPLLLALAGTGLMAVVIFAPAVPSPAAAPVSFAPPAAPPPVERWEPPAPDPAEAAFSEPWARAEREPAWPELIDPRAVACDAAARLALADGLGAVRAPWAEAILRRALDDEPEAFVRAAIAAALAS